MKIESTPPPRSHVVILSGGMDSSVALAFCRSLNPNDRILALNFHYGSKHNDRERECARIQAKDWGAEYLEVNLPFVNEHFKSDLLLSGGPIPEGHYEDESMKSTVVPFRNGIMLSIAAGIAESQGAGWLWYGAHSGDHAIYPDCRPDFYGAMAGAIAKGTYNGLVLMAPFMMQSKSNIVGLGSALGVKFVDTYSCYKGDELHCGKCGTCTERRLAFAEALMNDPTPYEI